MIWFARLIWFLEWVASFTAIGLYGYFYVIYLLIANPHLEPTGRHLILIIASTGALIVGKIEKLERTIKS